MQALNLHISILGDPPLLRGIAALNAEQGVRVRDLRVTPLQIVTSILNEPFSQHHRDAQEDDNRDREILFFLSGSLSALR